MHYNSEDEEAHVTQSSSSIQSNKKNSTPTHIAKLLPTELIQQNTENSPRIHSNIITSIKSSTSETDKSPPAVDNSIPQVSGHSAEPLINEAFVEEQNYLEDPPLKKYDEGSCLQNYVEGPNMQSFEGPLSTTDLKSQEIPSHVKDPILKTRQNMIVSVPVASKQHIYISIAIGAAAICFS